MSPIKRRHFLSSLLLSGAVIAYGKGREEQKPIEKMTIIHHVFFWLKEPENKVHTDLLKQGLQTLAAIPQVKQLLIGVPASTEKREVVDNSWQVSELMYFQSLEDQAAYQVHPIHKAFVEQYSHLWSKVVVYDMNAA
jgi:hypothetical protein